jgi:hypothetical protein
VTAGNGGPQWIWGFGGIEEFMGRRRPCELEDCSKWAQSGGTPHCVAHGGGKRCQEEDCTKSAVAGGTKHCVAHGGGTAKRRAAPSPLEATRGSLILEWNVTDYMFASRINHRGACRSAAVASPHPER